MVAASDFGDDLTAVESQHSFPDRKLGLLDEEEAAMGKDAKLNDGRKVQAGPVTDTFSERVLLQL